MELKNIRKIDCEIEALLFEQEKIKNRMEGLTGRRYDLPKVQSSGSYKDLSEGLYEFERLYDKINLRLLALAREKNDALNIIEKISDTRFRVILIERYINYKSWREIEKIMNYSSQHLWLIHRQAIDMFNELKKI